MPRRYHILDVFTDTALAGNPLAVVHDAAALGPDDMQALAREFNLSETVFVLPPENPGHRARLRIFTPGHEVPFAGHPTVGAAALLASLDAEADGDDDRLIVLEEGVGAVRVGVRLGGRAPYAEFDVPKLPEARTVKGTAPEIAASLGLMANEIGFDNHRACAFDAGLAYTYVPVRDEAVLARAAPISALFKQIYGAVEDPYVYTRTAGGFAARMFSPLNGIPEDPATGSAAAGFAGVVQRFESLKDGAHRIPIHQGREMGRPSRIDLEITLSAGALDNVRVGGHAVLIAEGQIL